MHALHVLLSVAALAPLAQSFADTASFVATSLSPQSTTLASSSSCIHYSTSTPSEPSSPPPTSSSTAETSSSSSSARSSQCPFSMSFPRYRIDLSSASSVNKRSKSNHPKSGGLFSGLRRDMDKSAIKRKYADDAHDGRLTFVDCSVPAESVALEKANEGDSGGVTEDKLRAGMEGLRAAAQFWRAVANVATEAEADDAEDQSTLGGQGNERIVLSFTGTTSLTVNRLADVASWLEDSTVNGSIEGLAGGPVVHVDVDEEAPLPTVIIERRRGVSDSGYLSEDEANIACDPPSVEIIEARIKAWVRRILVDLSICPFTKSSNRSGQGLGDLGIPTGRIAYHYSTAGPVQIPHLMADVWEAIVDMIEAGPGGKDGVSSILLAAPEFDSNFPLWAGPIFAMLESGVGAAAAEPLIGVVCFHPLYATPDGSSWPGFGHMHSVPRLRKWMIEEDPKLSETLSDDDVAAGGAWQRRTPHALLNVLRADQLEAAEGRRTSPQMYTRNIRVLVGGEDGIGSEKLQDDLTSERNIL